MRRKGHVCPQRPRRVGKAERIASSKAVPRHGELGHVEGVPQIVDGDVDDGVCHVRSVGGQEGGGVEGRIVEIRGRRLAVEEIGGDGEETGASEGVGEAGGEKREWVF